MPRTWTSEIALASGGVALSVAAGALGAKLAGAVDGLEAKLELSAAIRRFVAGGIYGACAKTVTAPLEAIKLKLQYFRGADISLMNRGDAAGTTWIVRGDESHAQVRARRRARRRGLRRRSRLRAVRLGARGLARILPWPRGELAAAAVPFPRDARLQFRLGEKDQGPEPQVLAQEEPLEGLRRKRRQRRPRGRRLAVSRLPA
jgi:hypothetical protein